MSKLNEEIQGARKLLAAIPVGMQKLASFSAAAAAQKTASASDVKAIEEAATTVASKMASMQIGKLSDVANNAAEFASDHLGALRSTKMVLDYLDSSSSKAAESPIGLGSAVGASAPRNPQKDAYRPIRC